MRGTIILIASILSSCTLKSASEPVRGYAEINQMQRALNEVKTSMISLRAAVLNCERELNTLYVQKIEFPWLVSFGAYLDEWEQELNKGKNCTFSIHLLLAKMIKRMKEMRTEASSFDAVEQEGKNIHTMMQSFLQHLMDASSFLGYLKDSVAELKGQAQRGNRVTWRVVRWHSQLNQQKFGLFRLFLGYYRLKDDVRVCCTAAGLQRSLSSPL